MLSAARGFSRWLDGALRHVVPDNVRFAVKGFLLDVARRIMPARMGVVRAVSSRRVVLPAWLLEHMAALEDIEPALRAGVYAPALRRIHPEYGDARMGEAYFRLLAAMPATVESLWIVAADAGNAVEALATDPRAPDVVIFEGAPIAMRIPATIDLGQYAATLSPELARQVLGRLCLQLAPARIVVAGTGLGLDLLAGHWRALSQQSELVVVVPDPAAANTCRLLALADQGAAAVSYLALSPADAGAWNRRHGVPADRLYTIGGAAPMAEPGASSR